MAQPRPYNVGKARNTMLIPEQLQHILVADPETLSEAVRF